ncbi:transglycosylase domain-containing protein [Actinocorallia libanotica]|uniref:Transglycosylase domain-containing protein n=1 Tax=Actinocorallia libanotica TaxID=46162 RepID=A0ABN1QBL1_9ACTN
MSNPPYGPGQGAPGNGPEDDWFRPAPQAREEIYRESEYGNSTPQFASHDAPYDDHGQNGHPAYGNGYDSYDQGGAYGPGGESYDQNGQPYDQNGQPYDDLYASPDGQGYAATTVNGAVGYDDDQTRLDGAPITDDPSGDGKKPSKKEGWKKYIPNWKIVAGVVVLGLVASGTLVGVGYATTDTPDLAKDAKEEATNQGSNVYWANKNAKPIFRVGQARENVKLDQVPLHVRQAVMAAEQRQFETEPGISPRGLMRAVYNTATGGQVQGGSTITQQLARNYLNDLSTERSIGRKFKEIFAALKMEDKYSKDVILEKYLNTIPFGRQADGIQAASRAYFHKNVDKLTVAEGALLAAMIQQPYYFCTRVGPQCPEDSGKYQGLLFRWDYVLRGMVTEGWLTQAEKDKLKFPKTEKSWVWTSNEDDQTSHIRERINVELADIPNFDEDLVHTGGYKIFTSLDRNLMRYAKQAVKEQAPKPVSKEMAKVVRSGLTVVNPENGAIVAFYGGNAKKEQSDAALVERPQIGSSFKPYVLATALSQNINVKSMIEGRGLICLDKVSGDVIPGAGSLEQCEGQHANGYWMRSTHSEGQAITLVKATEQSINSSFIRLALKLGLPKVVEMAQSFGLPKSAFENDMDKNASLALGTINVSAMYQAGGYATFANGGRAVTPHIITKIVKEVDGKVVEEVKLPWVKPGKQILTEDQAAQATVAMRAVVTQGTGTRARLTSQPAAGKTGTTDEGAATWFVGYTPQYSAAATVFHQNSKSLSPYIGRDIYGGDYAAGIWKAFMDKALAGKEVEDFPATSYSGQTEIYDSPKPKPKKTEKECNPLMQLAGQCGNEHDQPQPQNPADQPGCTEGNLLNCDPNKPPPGTEGAPPGWWCMVHPDYGACQNQQPGNPGQPVDNDGDGIPAGEDPNDNDPNWPNQQHP